MTSAANAAQPICHGCKTKALTPVGRPLYGVSSDCKPFGHQPWIFLCKACGLVQKETSAEWQRNVARIYGNYALYFQSANRSEQSVLSAAGFAPRSKHLVDLMGTFLELAAGSSPGILDYGCGSGVTLDVLLRAFPAAKVTGFDLSISDQTRQSYGARCNLVAGDIALLDGYRFDLIVLNHVFEHVPDPAGLLRRLGHLLNPAGKIVIQVPYYPENPFDLCIYDHCSHFDTMSISHLVATAGLRVRELSTELLHKEITLVAEMVGNSAQEHPAAGDLETSTALLLRELAWLDHAAQIMKSARGRPLGIFGTAIGGVWCHSVIEGGNDFFIDEDPGRIGGTLFGKPILGLRDIPPDATVLLPLAPITGREVAGKLAKLDRPDITPVLVPSDY